MRYRLEVKSVTAPTGGGDAVTDPSNPGALPNRLNTVTLDPGREWAGDEYGEGPVSDPETAYARFSTGEDTEAWLEKQADGTLIGWVRDGETIYRYPNTEAWALDVDGSQMQRTDAAAAPAAPADEFETTPPVDAVEANPAETVVPTAAEPPAADPTAEPDPDAEAEAALTADVDTTDDDEFVNPFAAPVESDGTVIDNTDAAELPDGDTEDDDGETEKDRLFKKGEKKSADQGIAPGPARGRGSAAARRRAAARRF